MRDTLYIWYNGAHWDSYHVYFVRTALPQKWVTKLMECRDLGRDQTPQLFAWMPYTENLAWNPRCKDQLFDFNDWFDVQYTWQAAPWEYHDEPPPSNKVWQEMPEDVYQQFYHALSKHNQFWVEQWRQEWPEDD